MKVEKSLNTLIATTCRAFVVGVAFTPMLFLSACAGDSNFGSATKTLETAVFGSSEVTYTDEYAKSLPYSLIGAKIGKGSKALLVLGKIDGRRLHWFGADRAVLVTEYGRVVQTGGLITDLVETRAREFDPLWHLQQGDRLSGKEYVRMVDFSQFEAVGMPVRSSWDMIGEERLIILGQEHMTLKYRERFASDLLEWEGENYYWLDKTTRQLKKSIQSYAPDSPSVEIEYLK